MHVLLYSTNWDTRVAAAGTIGLLAEAFPHNSVQDLAAAAAAAQVQQAQVQSSDGQQSLQQLQDLQQQGVPVALEALDIATVLAKGEPLLASGGQVGALPSSVLWCHTIFTGTFLPSSDAFSSVACCPPSFIPHSGVAHGSQPGPGTARKRALSARLARWLACHHTTQQLVLHDGPLCMCGVCRSMTWWTALCRWQNVLPSSGNRSSSALVSAGGWHSGAAAPMVGPRGIRLAVGYNARPDTYCSRARWQARQGRVHLGQLHLQDCCRLVDRASGRKAT